MKRHGSGWKDEVRAWGRHLRGGLWAAAFAGLIGVLALQAVQSREGDARLRGQSERLDRDLARARSANESMRRERRALDEDPVYLEALLRSWKRIGPGERRVE